MKQNEKGKKDHKKKKRKPKKQQPKIEDPMEFGRERGDGGTSNYILILRRERKRDGKTSKSNLREEASRTEKAQKKNVE